MRCSLVCIGEISHFSPFLFDRRRSKCSICLEQRSLAPLPSNFGDETRTEFEDFTRSIGWRSRVSDREDEGRYEFGLIKSQVREASEQQGDYHTLMFASNSGGRTVSVIALAAI